MIEVLGAGHWYTPERWVFRNLSLRVDRGEVLSILGPNGRGKTTLLKSLIGLIGLREGTVKLGGAAAFVPQVFHAGFQYSVLEMAVMGRARYVKLLSQPSRKDYAIAAEALDRVGLSAFASRPFNALSGGERQLVLIARALASRCEILVLDEPASALDLRNQATVLRLLAELAGRHGITVVYTTHHPQHALAGNSRVLLMLAADHYLTGTANDVLNEANLEALYGVPVKRVRIGDAEHAYAGLVPIYS
jgi:iron complex transport system ATP-binding protein